MLLKQGEKPGKILRLQISDSTLQPPAQVNSCLRVVYVLRRAALRLHESRKKIWWLNIQFDFQERKKEREGQQIQQPGAITKQRTVEKDVFTPHGWEQDISADGYDCKGRSWVPGLKCEYTVYESFAFKYISIYPSAVQTSQVAFYTFWVLVKNRWNIYRAMRD